MKKLYITLVEADVLDKKFLCGCNFHKGEGGLPFLTGQLKNFSLLHDSLPQKNNPQKSLKNEIGQLLLFYNFATPNTKKTKQETQKQKTVLF